MKVTYTQNRFEIEGIQIINPELIVDRNPDNGLFIRKYQSMHLMEGDSFDLPENIIAEKEDKCDNKCIDGNDCTKHEIAGCKWIEVYRLKLKESIEYVISRPVEVGIIETRMDASNKNKVETQDQSLMEYKEKLKKAIKEKYSTYPLSEIGGENNIKIINSIIDSI